MPASKFVATETKIHIRIQHGLLNNILTLMT